MTTPLPTIKHVQINSSTNWPYDYPFIYPTITDAQAGLVSMNYYLGTEHPEISTYDVTVLFTDGTTATCPHTKEFDCIDWLNQYQQNDAENTAWHDLNDRARELGASLKETMIEIGEG